MILASVPTYDASLFDWSKTTISEEASTLTATGGGARMRLYGALYDDAADCGLALRNPKTGGVTYWYLYDTHEDREGDVTHWTFKATHETTRKYPKLAAYTLLVWND